MFGNTFFWLGILGLVCGIMVGISLLEESSSVVRNMMLAIGIAIVMFIFIFQLGEANSVTRGNGKLGFYNVLALSCFIGAASATAIAFSMNANMRAAAIAGGLAGMTMYLMSKYLPSGSLGYTGMDDIPTLIDFAATIIVGGFIYYMLRNLGKDDERWG